MGFCDLVQREPAEADVIRVPGGTTVAKPVATVGLLTTAMTIAQSLAPQPDQPNNPRARWKVIGGRGALLSIGLVFTGRASGGE